MVLSSLILNLFRHLFSVPENVESLREGKSQTADYGPRLRKREMGGGGVGWGQRKFEKEGEGRFSLSQPWCGLEGEGSLKPLTSWG